MIATNPASQVVAALIVGLLIAFTCQLLLTNLGLAVGITIWGGQSWSRSKDNAETEGDGRSGDPEKESGSISAGTLSIAAGLGLLLTVNGVLATACYAAVKFCGAVTAFSGAVLGLVIWSAYMLVMTWLSTSAANSLVAFVLSSAVSGLRQIFKALSAVMQSLSGDAEASLTPATAAELVHQETQAAIAQIDIPALIEGYVDERMPPPHRLDSLQPKFEETLAQSDLARPEQQGFLPQVDLSTFSQWVKDELGVVGEAAEAIAELLHQAWERVTDNLPQSLQPLQDLFSTASAKDLTPEAVQTLLASIQQDSASVRPESSSEIPLEAGQSSLNAESSGEAKESVTSADMVDHLRQMLRQRVDLTDLDIQMIWSRVSPLLQDWLQGNASGLMSGGLSLDLGGQVIREDVADYLRQVSPWRLSDDTLQQDFRDLLVDPEAAADQVLPQLKALGSEDFVRSLRERGDLVQEQIEDLAAKLDTIRQSAIASLTELQASDSGQVDETANTESESEETNVKGDAPTAQQREAIAEIQQKLENYLHYTSLSQMTHAAIAEKVETLVSESALTNKALRQIRPELPMVPLTEVLSRRQGLDSGQQDLLIQQVQTAWQHHAAVEARSDEAEDKPISPKVMLAIEGALILTVSQLIAKTVKAQDLIPKLMEPLKETINDPQTLRRSLSQVNWPTLQKKAQIQLEASEVQVEQATQQVQTALTDFLKPPRRWALRRSAEVKTFWDSALEYLAHSSPDQLSPEEIRHNLEWLWRSSNQQLGQLGQGLGQLQDIQAAAAAEISSFDWGALKKTVAQRKDLTADQIETIWQALELFAQQLLAQADQARQQAQASLESWFSSISTILKSSEYLAFDPSRLKTDLQALLSNSPDISALQPLKLLSAPEGIAAAVAQFAQDAFRQLLKAQGVSETLLAQAEDLKDWVQERVAGVEQEIRHRQAALQQAALEQLNEARKALAAAAWWLFAIAVTSATTAITAGVLAVTGVDGLLTRLGL